MGVRVMTKKTPAGAGTTEGVPKPSGDRRSCDEWRSRPSRSSGPGYGHGEKPTSLLLVPNTILITTDGRAG